MLIKKEKGQGMVEFALILPILILVICGIIDFGWIFGNQIIANNATREAARYTAIHYSDFSSDSEAATEAKNIITGKALSLSDVNIIIPVKSGDSVTISLEGTLPILTPFTSIFVGDTYTIKAKSVMRLE